MWKRWANGFALFFVLQWGTSSIFGHSSMNYKSIQWNLLDRPCRWESEFLAGSTSFHM